MLAQGDVPGSFLQTTWGAKSRGSRSGERLRVRTLKSIASLVVLRAAALITIKFHATALYDSMEIGGKAASSPL